MKYTSALTVKSHPPISTSVVKLTIELDVKQKIWGDCACLGNFHHLSKLKKMTSAAKRRALKSSLI